MRAFEPEWILAAALFATTGLRAAVDAEQSLAMPENATFEIGGDGNFLVDGKPRFLIGNLYYAHYGKGELVHGPGYGAEHAWIYETPPDRAYLQRLGFDTSGGEVSSTWLGKYRDPRRFYQARNAIEWDVAQGCWDSGLPMVVDFTCASWSHGGMKYIDGRKPEASAFVDDCHFIYYSLVTPEGRDLWRDMWRSGAEELKAHGARPYVYELFNEPSYDDRSPAARIAFAEFLSAMWKDDASAMDRAWGSSYGSFSAAAGFKSDRECDGLHVAWHKFREECFKSGVRLGIETIRAVDPDARFCFQPLSRLRDTALVIDAYGLCEISMMPTGGGSLYEDMLIRAISDGKPMIDGEAYLGKTRASHRARLVTEWSRGLNASYYFKWERRMREVDSANPDESLKRQAERFPWLGLSPACVPPEELVGIMNAKRDIFAMQDLFGPRERGTSAAERAATLFSMPTMRRAETTKRRCAAYSETCATALAVDAHVPLDAVFEEQLEKGRLDRYRILVAAGVDSVYDGTPARIEAWVRAGGTLVLSQEAMELDEWGNLRRDQTGFPGVALGESVGGEAETFSFLGADYSAAAHRRVAFAAESGWEVLASLPSGHPAVARCRLGDGFVYYVGVRFPRRGDEGRLVAMLAKPLGVRPTSRSLDYVSGRDVDGIEVHAAKLENGDTGFVVLNTTLASKTIRFIPGADFSSTALLDVSTRTVLGRDGDGAVVLTLPPNEPVVLRGAASEDRLSAALADAPAAWNANGRNEFHHETYDAAYARIPKFLSVATTSTKAFPVDPSRIATIDLREYADVALGDVLKNPPWGTVECAGVPFDFMRPDQNRGFSALTRADGIPVNLRARTLYFLHAGRGAKNGCAIRYLIAFSDGTSAEYEAEAFGSLGDIEVSVPSPLPESLDCAPGWGDAERRGLWVSKWENPYPEKTIATIGISAVGDFSPLVVAISAEAAPNGCGASAYASVPKASSWGGARIAVDKGNGEVSVDFASARGWAGFGLEWKSAPEFPTNAPAADLEFDVRTDGLPVQDMQLKIGSGRYHLLAPFLRKLSKGRWRASVPLEYSNGDATSIGIQLRGECDARCAASFVLGEFRIAWRGERDNPLEFRRFAPDAMDGARCILRDGGAELAVADNDRHWCSLHLRLAEPIPAAGRGELLFEVNSGRTPLGVKGSGRQRLRVAAQFGMPDGKEERLWLEKVRVEGGKVDDNPWTWQTVRVPFAVGIPDGAVDIRRLVLSLLDMPQDGRSGLVFRNFRFEQRQSPGGSD